MALILASASEIRLRLLTAAGLTVQAMPARIDESNILAALHAEGASPRDIADTLAEMKARKLADRHPADLIIGCDQVLDYGNQPWSKPETPAGARAQLAILRGQTHHLHSAIVLYEGAKPIWRHIGRADLSMHQVSDAYLDDYVERNWHSIRDAVGSYKLEEEGIRLFSDIKGDYFTILGLPMLPLLAYFRTKGVIAT